MQFSPPRRAAVRKIEVAGPIPRARRRLASTSAPAIEAEKYGTELRKMKRGRIKPNSPAAMPGSTDTNQSEAVMDIASRAAGIDMFKVRPNIAALRDPEGAARSWFSWGRGGCPSQGFENRPTSHDRPSNS